MSRKPETVFRAKVRTLLDAIPHSWWESIQQKAIRGTPDVLGCVRGYFIAIEFKATVQDKTTKLQEYKLEKIALAGGFSFVVHPGNYKNTLMLLNQLSEGL